MTAYDAMNWTLVAGAVALMAGAVYADYRVKKAQRILDQLRAEREAAE